LPARIGTTSKHIHSPVDAERVGAVQYMTMDAIKVRIEQLSGNVRGLTSKAEYAESLVLLEQAALQQQPAATMVQTEAAQIADNR